MGTHWSTAESPLVLSFEQQWVHQIDSGTEISAVSLRAAGAAAAALAGEPPAAADIINTWASDKTQRKIRRIADGMIDLVN